MKQRVKNKIFKNRWRLNYTLGQIFTALRGCVFFVYPANGYEYFLNYHNGKITKMYAASWLSVKYEEE